MRAMAALIQKSKAIRNLRSDQALGDQVGVTRQTVGQWKNDYVYPEEEKIAELALLAGDEPGGWLAAIRAERCTGKASEAYRKIARSLGVAAALCIAVYTSILPETAQAAGFDINPTHYALCIVAAMLARFLILDRGRPTSGEFRHETTLH